MATADSPTRPAPYMSTLPLPALRLTGTVAPERLVQDLAPLAKRVTERAQKARDEGQIEARSAVETLLALTAEVTARLQSLIAH